VLGHGQDSSRLACTALVLHLARQVFATRPREAGAADGKPDLAKGIPLTASAHRGPHQLELQGSGIFAFGLGVDKTVLTSQVIGAAKEAGMIKADESETTSTRYARYLPFWA